MENNRITDEQGVCALLMNLKNYDKIESLNIRQNDFSPAVVAALAEGISNKKELRVSCRLRKINMCVDCGSWREPD